ncbi:MAG: Rpn family recombination-promoting nuclease/putative transposase, partial [Bacteroides sp.]|nr:Rpn family recombination-promoting nuclease/putative transposase [Roseburia sp.]MCM1462536.1 Rpn family recombination-promoting nuclease/putative transposase [Bacteroides sp.]
DFSNISCMLSIPEERIRSITVTNPELPPETLDGKFSRLDLSLQVDDKLVNVEIQMKNQPDFRDRTIRPPRELPKYCLTSPFCAVLCRLPLKYIQYSCGNPTKHSAKIPSPFSIPEVPEEVSSTGRSCIPRS